MLIVWTEQFAAQYAGYTGYNGHQNDLKAGQKSEDDWAWSLQTGGTFSRA